MAGPTAVGVEEKEAYKEWENATRNGGHHGAVIVKPKFVARDGTVATANLPFATMPTGSKVAPSSQQRKRESIKREVALVRRRLKRSSGGTLDPNGTYMARWDLVTTSFLLFTAVVTPVEVGFTRQLGGLPEQWAIWWLNRLVDVVFIKDIVVQFFLPYQDETRGA